ncbi:hypothetical protein EV182_005454, partial [Spiromyces aspiralis]
LYQQALAKLPKPAMTTEPVTKPVSFADAVKKGIKHNQPQTQKPTTNNNNDTTTQDK